MKLDCRLCGKLVIEVIKGKVRTNTVAVCPECWARMRVALNTVEAAQDDMPEFLRDAFERFRT